MTTPYLQLKQQGDLYGFVDSSDNWVIKPIYFDGDKKFTEEMIGVLLNRYQEEEEVCEFIYKYGEVINLTKKLKCKGEIRGIDLYNEFIEFDEDDLFGLYSTVYRKVILQPIAREIDIQNGLIYIWADGSLIANTYDEELCIENHDFCYLTKSGSFLTNRGHVVERLDDHNFILEDHEPKDPEYPHILHFTGETYSQNPWAGDLVKDIGYWAKADLDNIIELHCTSDKKGFYNFQSQSWVKK